MKNPDQRKEVKGEILKKEFCLKQKKLRADKIRRKYLRLSQVFKKCHSNQAKNVQSKLIVVDEYPSTVKWLQKSNVSVGFHLPFPIPFCKAHLPVVDTVMVLETEAGEQYETKYLPRLFRLSAGWRRFTLDKKLEVGDAVVFRLVEPTKFKVSFIRTNSANEVNPPVHLPVHLLHPVNHVNRRVSNKTNNYQLIVYKRGVHQVTENCSPKSQRPKTRNTGGSILLRKGILFSNITTFEEFEAAIQDLLQNHELPYGALHDYYELCCCQNAFLHEHLFEEFNPKLNGPIIIEAMKKIILDTVGLANALRTCKLSTFLHKYAMWDHTLSTYQTLGMNVGFLHARLHHLRSFAVKAEAEKSRYKEACNERGFTEGEVRKLDVILAKLRELKAIASAKLNPLVFAVEAEIKDLEVLLAKFEKFFGQYDAHIDALKLEAKNCELKFKEEASTSWFTLT